MPWRIEARKPLRWLAGALLLPACWALPALAQHDTPSEPLPSAIRTGRVLAEALRGREVYALDETRLGTLVLVREAGLVRVEAMPGEGAHCLTVPLGRLRLGAEGRLILDMNEAEFRAALARAEACRA